VCQWIPKEKKKNVSPHVKGQEEDREKTLLFFTEHNRHGKNPNGELTRNDARRVRTIRRVMVALSFNFPTFNNWRKSARS